MQKTLLICLCLGLSLIARTQTTPTETKPFVLGSIVQLPSALLGETRTLNIYLPEGYTSDDTSRYPVIYLLDGSADEDYIHVVGLVQFANFPWVDLLPKSIVVGIANVDRKRDFTFPTSIAADKKQFPTTGGSEKFIAFLEKELQPFIDQNYRSNAHQTIIGQSLGGLLATEILFNKPGLFDRYLIVSPSLWWNQESLLRQEPALSKPDFKAKTEIYVAVGKEGKVMVNDARALYKKLKSIHHPAMQLEFEYFGGEDHASILHQAVYRAFYRFKQNKPKS